MARTDTLPHFLTDVADAIRTKSGTSGTIQASTFDTAIANIPSGGSLTMGYIDLNVSPSNYGVQSLTFGNLLGEPQMYVVALGTQSSSAFYLSVSMTTMQIWDGTSQYATNHGMGIRYNSSNYVNISTYVESNKTPGTYNSANNTFTVNDISIPRQVGSNWQVYRLYYFY